MSQIITFTQFKLAELVLANMKMMMDDDHPIEIYISNRTDGGVGFHATAGGGVGRTATFGGNRTAVDQIDVGLMYMEGAPEVRRIEAYFRDASAYQAAVVICNWLLNGQLPNQGSF